LWLDRPYPNLMFVAVTPSKRKAPGSDPRADVVLYLSRGA
jgi:hypothetical protein